MPNPCRLGLLSAALLMAAACSGQNPQPASEAAQLSSPQTNGPQECLCPDGYEPAGNPRVCCTSCYGGLYPPRVDDQGCYCGCRGCDCLGCGPDGDPVECLTPCGLKTVCPPDQPICCDPVHGICVADKSEVCTL
jgi:hypothetical protein